LLYLEIHKAYKKMKLNHDSLLQKFDLSESKFTIMMLLSYEKKYDTSSIKIVWENRE